jgi:hypothetical protein
MSIEVFHTQNLGYTPIPGTIISQDSNGLCEFYTGTPFGYVKSVLKLTSTNHNIYAAIEVDGNYHIDTTDVNDMMTNGIAQTNAVSRYGTSRFTIQNFSGSIDSLIYVDSFGRLTDVSNGNCAVGMVASYGSYDVDLVWFGDWCGTSVPVRHPLNKADFSPAFAGNVPVNIQPSPATNTQPGPPFPSGQAYVAHLKAQAALVPDASGKYNPPAQCKKCNYINEYIPSGDYTCRRCIVMYNLNS